MTSFDFPKLILAQSRCPYKFLIFRITFDFELLFLNFLLIREIINTMCDCRKSLERLQMDLRDPLMYHTERPFDYVRHRLFNIYEEERFYVRDAKDCECITRYESLH